MEIYYMEEKLNADDTDTTDFCIGFNTLSYSKLFNAYNPLDPRYPCSRPI